jgi:uncharacterized protein (TIGR03032 family)
VHLDTEFIRLPAAFDVARMRAEVAAIPESSWRSHPQGHPGNSALPLIARGGNPLDDGVAGTMLPTESLARCEYLAQVLGSFGTIFGRSRLMRLEGRSSATLHVDTNYYWAERVRVHVPILTSPAIEFLCADRALHMAAGEAWIFDASKPHDVVNPTGDQRIHLVADTVGSPGFWELVARGHRPFAPGAAAPFAPRAVPHRPGERALLETERFNVPVVMSPWEQADLVRSIVADIAPGADPEAVGALRAALSALLADWRTTWARFGETEEGWPVYERILAAAEDRIAPLAGRVALPYGGDAVDIARQLLLRVGLNPEVRPAPAPAPALAPPPAVRRRLDRPIVIVAPPRSGSTLLFETLAQAPGVFTVGGESHAVIEGIAELTPAERGWDSNRLTHVDARPEVVRALHERFAARLRDRDGAPPPPDLAELRILEKTPKNALRTGFLDAVFGDALFVYLHREPREVLASLIESWSSGGFVTYPDLPDWPGPPWSHVLTPEWRALAGRPLAEVVAAQWAAAAQTALDDLERLAPERWIGVDHAALVGDPAREIERIAAFAGIGWDRELTAPLPPSSTALTPPHPEKWRAHEDELAPLLDALEPLAERSRAAVREQPAPPARVVEPLRSSATSSLAEILDGLGSSVVVSTYQSGKLVTLRAHDGRLNTHFRDLESPMGIAHDGNRLAVGTLAGIAEYRDVPAVAVKLAPDPAAHDACFIQRRLHVTGDLRVHDLAYADDELWMVATRFSCLATLDEDHSFVPRWRPPFVTGLSGDDRCHLNGLAVVDGRPRWVTALGATDAPEGWRSGRARGGVLVDVDSGETAVAELSMPHSPRWHDGRLWVLESGEGSLALVDPEGGRVETVVQLPGFTRGLAFAGPFAFVGLSQVREAGTFGGLPLTGRLEARQSGVWVVDLRSGAIVAFVRFEDAVQEIFDVAVLGGRRFPEIAEPGSEATRFSYVVPDQPLGRAGAI